MKKRHITTTVALMLLTAAVTFCMTFYASESRYNAKLLDINRREQEYAKIAEVRGYIDKYYVSSYNDANLTDGAVYGIVAALGDEWSHYLTADQFAALANTTNNKLVGIGVNVAYDEANKAIYVLDVYEDSPAESAGIKPRDLIVKVGGTPVSELGYSAAVQNVSGDVGTSVNITITREGVENPIELSITRKELDVQGVKAKILPGNIGYIKISNFDANIDKDVAAALDNLKKAEVAGMIFDVRNNPGGLLDVLVKTLDPLLPEGIIITEKDKMGTPREYRSDANELEMPIAVLTNEYTISAAEFFAAALSESGKATLVGEPTTGKGRAQSPIKLKDGSGLVLSVSEYFTASGKSLDAEGGVKPDVLIPLNAEEKKNFYMLSDENDRQLQAAIGEINKALTPEPAPAEETPAE